MIQKYPNCSSCDFRSRCPVEVCLGWEIELKEKEERLLSNEVRVQESLKTAKKAAKLR